MTNVGSFVRWAWTGVGAHPVGNRPISDEELLAYTSECSASANFNLRWLAVVATVMNILFWATDAWLLRAFPLAIEVLDRTRLQVSVVGVFTIFGTILFPNHPRLLGMIASTTVFLLISSCFADIGGPSTPWFHFLCPFMLWPIIVPLAPIDRMGFQALLTLVVVIGYFGHHPEHLQDSLTPCSMGYLLYVSLFTAFVGLFVDHNRARTFFLRQAVDIREANLAACVAEQTADIQRLLQNQERIREHERTHLARELHDELAQELTALRFTLSATHLKALELAPELTPNLNMLASLLARTTRMTRALLTDLHPQILHDLGLGAAIDWLGNRTKERNLACDVFTSVAAETFPPEIALATFRIVQESLTNASRHANATRATVRLDMKKNTLIASVSDDGEGFDSVARRSGASGMGLLAMRERARAVGGSLEVRSSPGGGTTVIFCVPLAGGLKAPT